MVNSWTGGLMLYRDGFRVNPYGSKADDWLDLNTQAFKSSGYLLNTDQLLGRVSISREMNPKLVDQKEALARLSVKSLAEFRRRLHKLYAEANGIRIEDTVAPPDERSVTSLRRAAIHESGHAVAILAPSLRPVQRIGA